MKLLGAGGVTFWATTSALWWMYVTGILVLNLEGIITDYEAISDLSIAGLQ